MTSCTIIISHYKSLSFLRACVRQIHKYKHPAIEQYIIIADQSSEEKIDYESFAVFEDDLNTTFAKMKPLYSGYGIDWVLRNLNIKTDFICQLHVDAFPIHKNWLYLPIKLIEEYNLSFVGQLQTISKPDDTIYPPNKTFFALSPTFNVARTETYKEMSEQAGFTRFHNRPQSGLTFKNNDWDEWAKEDYNARGSDDDMVAYCWEDNHKEHDKLALAITGFIGAAYGRIIEDILFHFGSCRESIGVIDTMPEMYKSFTERINSDYSDELIDEMVSLAKINKTPQIQILVRNYWDGKLKQHSPPSEELNKRIEELKK